LNKTTTDKTIMRLRCERFLMNKKNHSIGLQTIKSCFNSISRH